MASPQPDAAVDSVWRNALVDRRNYILINGKLGFRRWDCLRGYQHLVLPHCDGGLCGVIVLAAAGLSVTGLGHAGWGIDADVCGNPMHLACRYMQMGMETGLPSVSASPVGWLGTLVWHRIRYSLTVFSSPS